MKHADSRTMIKKNHMDILWHEYTTKSDATPITDASLPEKASIVGRVGIMMLACGTGACATTVACILNDKTENEVTVHLLGGDLKIRWDREVNQVYMTGPATVVFDGEITLPDGIA